MSRSEEVHFMQSLKLRPFKLDTQKSCALNARTQARRFSLMELESTKLLSHVLTLSQQTLSRLRAFHSIKEVIHSSRLVILIGSSPTQMQPIVRWRQQPFIKETAQLHTQAQESLLVQQIRSDWMQARGKAQDTQKQSVFLLQTEFRL
jgi:hypothetical protein